jgi:hypothetical protein
MARVKTSALISDISGKINGTVFQRNQGGLIMRNQSGKINSNTLRSNSQKVGISSIQGYWQGLSDAERLLWQTYALYLNKKQRRNNSLNINGHQLFINVNSVRYALRDFSALFVPYLMPTPVLLPPPLPINITAITDIGLDVEVSLDRVVLVVLNVCVLSMSKILSPSQQSAHQKLTIIKTYTNTGTVLSVGAAYQDIYGRMPEIGEWVQTKISIWDDGVKAFSSPSVQRIQVQ